MKISVGTIRLKHLVLTMMIIGFIWGHWEIINKIIANNNRDHIDLNPFWLLVVILLCTIDAVIIFSILRGIFLFIDNNWDRKIIKLNK